MLRCKILFCEILLLEFIIMLLLHVQKKKFNRYYSVYNCYYSVTSRHVEQYQHCSSGHLNKITQLIPHRSRLQGKFAMYVYSIWIDWFYITCANQKFWVFFSRTEITRWTILIIDREWKNAYRQPWFTSIRYGLTL